MNVRMVLLVGFAILSAAATFFLAKTWIDSQRDAIRRQAESLKPTTTESVNVLVAKADLPSGLIVKREHMEWRAWPEKGVAKNFLMEGRDKMEEVVDAVVRGGIVAGEPIVRGRVLKPGDRGFMAAVLKPDMRAISVKVKPFCLSISITPMSVMMVLTTCTPVNGRLQSSRILCLPLAVCSMVTTTLLPEPTRSMAPPIPGEVGFGVIKEMGESSRSRQVKCVKYAPNNVRITESTRQKKVPNSNKYPSSSSPE